MARATRAYAARVDPARSIHSAISARLAPIVDNDLTSASISRTRSSQWRLPTNHIVPAELRQCGREVRMTITLRPDQEKLVDQAIESGAYQDPHPVIERALRCCVLRSNG